MSTNEELRQRLVALQSRSDALALRQAIDANAPALEYHNRVQELNRERLAKAERDHLAAEKASLAASLAKVKAELAEQATWRRRQTTAARLAQFDSAEQASAIREVGD